MTVARKPSTIAAGRRRLIAANARLAELRVGRAAGELVPAAEVERTWSAIVIEARGQLLAVPSQLASRRPTLSREDIDVVEALIRAALEGLAAGRPPHGDGHHETPSASSDGPRARRARRSAAPGPA